MSRFTLVRATTPVVATGSPDEVVNTDAAQGKLRGSSEDEILIHARVWPKPDKPEPNRLKFWAHEADWQGGRDGTAH
jgi:hypothetical protein